MNISHPNTKINLGLLIKGKLPNGYHLLETVLFPMLNLRDELQIEESKNELSLKMEGIEIEGNIADNLCVRAYNALKEKFPDLPPIAIYLKKNIPAGAGLGGGSADAAFTLKAVNELFRLGVGEDELAKIGTKLGADVPFFIYNRPLLASGIGTDFEEITLDLSHYRIELITPPIHSSTIAAYKALDYRLFDANRSLKMALQSPVEEWKKVLHNDLELPVFQLYPALAKIKAELYEKGAIYAAMSGSGSAMFGIFDA
jgi:4-diphosphocytidyl-2-C-methyl-D-erythritol kinase